MIKFIKNLYKKYTEFRENRRYFKKNGFFGERANDPLYNCEFYKDNDCSHVDGMLCDMETCEILLDYKLVNRRNK